MLSVEAIALAMEAGGVVKLRIVRNRRFDRISVSPMAEANDAKKKVA